MAVTVILEATAGPIAGRRIEIRSGSILRIGRNARSDYAIAEDSYLSGQHFAIECDGAQCRVRDLGSSNGTFVNGDRVTERIVEQGDSVAAGGCTFAVHVDLSEPPPAPGTPRSPFDRTIFDRRTLSASEWPGFSRSQSALLDAIYKPDENIYAVLDGSRDSRLTAFLDASGEPYAKLDPQGRVPVYAAAVPPHSRLLDVLIKDGWGQAWGVYCAACAGLDEICAHWSGYVSLRTGDGRAVTFRFWDPAVLRALAPCMPAAEAAEFFGPVNRIVLESGKPDHALEFSLAAGGARQRQIPLV